jgi:hypothetical protein
MKILVFLLILTLNFVNVVNSNLSQDEIIGSIIAAYDFESTDRDDEGFYVENLGSHKIHGYLRRDAYLSGKGKHGKALSLANNDHLHVFAKRPPSLVNDEISIVSYVKVPPQNPTIYFSLEALNANGIHRSSRDFLIFPNGDLNIRGGWNVEPPGIGAGGFGFSGFRSENQNTTDNNWHHIAYSHNSGIHNIYIDGEVVFSEKYQSPNIDGEFISIIIGGRGKSLTNEVLVDDLGFFGIGLSTQEIQYLYNNGLEKLLNPPGELTATWGYIKTQ